jgi:NitT/TauT family transport system substrate-binding protein
MSKRTVHRICFILISILLLAAGCSQQPEPDQVSLQLKWVHQAQFAGYYVAQEQGYYAEENVEVTLLEGGPEVGVVEEVLHGEADLGVYSPEDLLIAQSQGEPLVSVAVVYQLNPMVFAFQEDSGINHPADLLGKTVSVAPDGEIQFQAMMENLDLDLGQVNFVPYSYQYEGFYAGEVDVTEAYATGGLIRMRNNGYQVDTIWPGDYGVQFYSDTLFSTEEYLENNEDVVVRFMRASLKGWRKAIEEPELAVDETMVYAREADRAVQEAMLRASLPLIHTGEYPLGWMDRERWGAMQQILFDQGLLESRLPLDELYTNSYLEDVYGGAQ